MTCHIYPKASKAILFFLILMLASCTTSYNDQDLQGKWEVIEVEVTQKSLSTFEKDDLRRNMTGQLYEFLSNGEFLFGKGKQLFSAGGWKLNESTQKLELKFDEGPIKRMSFGIAVIDENHMYWSFTSSTDGGQIWQLERTSSN